MATYSKNGVKKEIIGKLRRHFSRDVAEATREQVYQACALVIRDALTDRMIYTQNELNEQGGRQVHYLCMEFLVGRSLRSNAFNLSMQEALEGALADLGYEAQDIFAEEEDPGLGNGGLGRLAACYMDSMATIGIHGNGYSIRYENGNFRQKIENGVQVELPSSWLDTGAVWQISAMDDVREVRIGGAVNSIWQDGKLTVEHVEYTPVLAVPYDMPISGYHTDNVARLRLWQAKSPIALDMQAFSQGDYLGAVEKVAMAESISKVLYPEDNHLAGQSLRLKQQYFLVSATAQDICARHKAHYGTLENFAEKNVLHINDTHPALVIPELMRILMDEEGMGWDGAWHIVSQSVAYTNHTVTPESLECWPTDLVQAHMPRIMMILAEINERYCQELWNYFPGDFERISSLAIIADGQVRMANLAIVGSFSVNGVSALHSDILKERVFADQYHIYPAKFRNVTNGIALRRWLCEANPELTSLIASKIGNGFISHPSELQVLRNFGGDAVLLRDLAAVKRRNKERLAAYIKEHNHIEVNLDSIFDVQAKRLHGYKRQLLNIIHVVDMYHFIKNNPHVSVVPRTVIFASKASPNDTMAKRTIQLMLSVAHQVNRDPDMEGKLKIIFLEDYRVSLAELIMPAAELSEQISVAGREASGTGNMKFMMSGALTIGTMDGANVEICQAVGSENIFIFGMGAEEAQSLAASGEYYARDYYNTNPALKEALDHIRRGFDDGEEYNDIVSALIDGGPGKTDHFMVCRDYESYGLAQERVDQMYRRPENWNYMSLVNIANSGRFAADRSVAEYAQNIWRVHTSFAY